MLLQLIKKHGSKKISLSINDLICLLVSAYFALSLTSGKNIFGDVSLGFIEKKIIFAVGALLIIPIFRYYQLYKHKYFLRIGEQILLILKGLAVNSIIIIILTFLIKSQETLHESRTQVILYFSFSFVLLFISRVFIFRSLLKSKYLGGNLGKFLTRRAIAIGAGGLGRFFAKGLEFKPYYHIDLIGFLDDDITKKGEKIENYPVLGTSKELSKIVTDEEIDAIYITIQKINHKDLLELIERCKLTKCQVNLVSNHFEIIHTKWDDNEFYDFKVISISPKTSPLYSEKLKRMFDISASLILIILAAVPSLFFALLIKITSRGPVFYKTNVIGKDSESFYWYKFRTMFDKNDYAVHQQHLKKLISENYAYQKLVNDNRITSFGKFLRKFSLDELPQLLNVLKGEMSLVGPRPCLPYEYEIYKDWHKIRYKVIPGMTGLAQITARNRHDVSFNDAVLIDLYYADNQSLWLDLKILFKTIPTVVFGKGGV